MSVEIHLNVILVGSNPLPCYIQAAYVLGERPDAGAAEEQYLPQPDCLLFVSTGETGIYENYIKDVLRQKHLLAESGHVTIESLSLENGRDAEIIEQKVREKIETLEAGYSRRNAHISHILLNNTGGTKTMAVYATEAVRSLSFANSVRVVDCYVDPDENRLRCFVKADGVAKTFPKAGDLRDYVSLSISQLSKLHFGVEPDRCKDINGDGKREKDPGNFLRERIPEGFLKICRDICASDTSYEVYSMFFTHFRDESPYSKLQGCKLLGKIMGDLPEFYEKNSEARDLFGGSLDKKLISLFITGDWFEVLFYRALLLAKERLKAKGTEIQTAWSCAITPGGKGKNMELDVLAMRGYQMTLYSVSIAGEGKGDEGLAKGKWFEAVYRTEQLAGEHGRVVIVNHLKDDRSEEFKKNLETFGRTVTIYNRRSFLDEEKLVSALVDELK